MLNAIIRLAMRNRMLVLTAAIILSAWGFYTAVTLPTDVLPDLNRPTVTIFTEAPGLAPEEVETQVTYPIETVVNGSPGVERVRSVSGLGLSIVFVEFGWNVDIKDARVVVGERMAQVKEKMPPGVTPELGPVSSIMGEIMLVGVRSDSISPMEVRSLAEWVIRPTLLGIPGVSQVTVMGGELKQFQVQADPVRLREFSLTLEDLEQALSKSSKNTGGGFLVGPSQELIVRNIGRVQTVDDIANSLVAMRSGGHEGPPRPVLVRDVATVKEAGALVKRGDGSMNGKPAVIMAIAKQPSADTRELTARIDRALETLRPSLPKDLIINADLFRQSHFIENSINNVLDSLRDGTILVVVVLILFLLNVRTTFITLMAIPLSLLMTALVFHWLGLSVNTMTLGGIAVAIGELVDDAIVGVENVFRRLRENRHSPNPRHPWAVIYTASSEVRNSIVYGTIIVLLVFIPLFALSGIEGRLFKPLALGYIISILASLLVSLTVTPVLCMFLLSNAKAVGGEKDGPVLRFFKMLARRAYGVAMPHPWLVIAGCAALVVMAVFLVTRLGSEFLPPFNEGTAVVGINAAPGTSLTESDRLGTLAEQQILSVPEVKSVGRRTGRAEQDEHAEGVHSSEMDVDFWRQEETKDAEKHLTVEGRQAPASLRPHQIVLQEIDTKLNQLPGIVVSIGQPISHRIDHLLSGVQAQIAVKISGDDLATLRSLAKQVKAAMDGIKGVVDLQVEQQTLVPEVQIKVKREAAARAGFTPGALTDALEIAMKGKAVNQVLDGLKSYDIVVQLSETYRNDLDKLRDIRLISPTGAVVRLSDVATIDDHVPGPNQIVREDIRRRIVVSCNVRGRDLGSTIAEIQKSVAMDVKLPQGYNLTYGGQFESQQSATRTILFLSLFSLAAMFLVLYAHFHSAEVVLQIMLNIPFAFIGSVAALWLTGQPFSVASLVGFISLCGISSRNGVLMISHYIHLMTEEGVPFGREMVVRGSQERVAPVLMTALTAGLGLVPLVLASGQPGKEILYPVAVVVLGGLFTCTILDFFVTPTIFLRFGGKASKKIIDRHKLKTVDPLNAGMESRPAEKILSEADGRAQSPPVPAVVVS